MSLDESKTENRLKTEEIVKLRGAKSAATSEANELRERVTELEASISTIRKEYDEAVAAIESMKDKNEGSVSNSELNSADARIAQILKQLEAKGTIKCNSSTRQIFIPPWEIVSRHLQSNTTNIYKLRICVVVKLRCATGLK